jgi:leucyl aminopeptidase
MKTWIALALTLPLSALAKPVLADLHLMMAADLPIIHADTNTGIAYAELNEQQEHRLSHIAHANGRCGGYEDVTGMNLAQAKNTLQTMSLMKLNAEAANRMMRQYNFPEKKAVSAAVSELKAQNLRDWVAWMSSYPQRFNRAADPNVHVRALVEKLNSQIQAVGAKDVRVETIDHTSTKQKSIRVTFPGTTRPNETLVLGAHFDSINHWNPNVAPGADDDASGSANLLEVFRVLLTHPRTERSLEFFWYAGEESGLLGSAEIAKSYKALGKNIVGVLQLDMTLFPGAGVNKMGLINDFTNPWLNNMLKGLNETYVKAIMIDDKCGYGCSDHASWHRQGFPAATPFESTSALMNKNLHTPRDVIDNQSDFEHSLLFSKLALAYFLELGNSTLTAP